MNILSTLRSCLVLQIILGSEQIAWIHLGKVSKGWKADLGIGLKVCEQPEQEIKVTSEQIWSKACVLGVWACGRVCVWEALPLNKLYQRFWRQIAGWCFSHNLPFLCRCRPPPCVSLSAWAAQWFLAACFSLKSTSSCSILRKTWPHSGANAAVPAYLQRSAPAYQEVQAQTHWIRLIANWAKMNFSPMAKWLLICGDFLHADLYNKTKITMWEVFVKNAFKFWI